MRIIVCQLDKNNGIVDYGFGIIKPDWHRLIGYKPNQHSQAAILGACTTFRLVVKK